LVLADIYPAGEPPIPGISADKLAGDIRRGGHHAVEFVGEAKSAAAKILPRLKSGDLFLTLGAGNVYAAGENLLKILR
jgi:UDP-N-acetylmuramate--alanine ligase